MGGKGLFVKELEHGLLNRAADLAVHSMKDVPADLPEDLHLPVILEREDPRDALVSSRFNALSALPEDAKIGTSSLRRQAQIRRYRPRASIVPLRGNVGTRLSKLETEGLDAVILAAAGLIRLGKRALITEWLSPEICLPAVGQGAIGIECRRGDDRIESMIAVLHHPDTADCVLAERSFNARLDGGCQVPIAGYAQLQGDRITLSGRVADPDGSQMLAESISGPRSNAESLGVELAERLLDLGARSILSRVLGS